MILAELPHFHKELYGFDIRINKETMHDQWGGKWKNIAKNENSLILEPVDPNYLDVFMDIYNNLLLFNDITHD